MTSSHGIPLQLTSFIGREHEVAEVRRLLGSTRLLTLTGAGGSGKTRLASRVAAELAGDDEAAVAWVELAALENPELLPAHVAAALGVKADGDPLDTLLAWLADHAPLLVLDNCEHLVDACARLADAVLRAAPGVRILATSREALGVGGERAWLVPALSLPASAEPSPEAAARSEAVRLFVERAQALAPSFALTSRNADAVARVCRRLDGIPLAIELAAARVRVLTPEQILDRLGDAFRLLSGGSRTAVPRQQTLRATLDWSHALLSDPERTLLRRVSAFSGGFALEAAEAVCADAALEAWEVLDLLSALVDKSLVGVETRAGRARYALLETVRQYGRERLRESGEEEAVLRRHAAFFLALAEEQEENFAVRLGVPPAIDWLLRQAEDHDNLRAALRWLLDRGEVELSTRLAAALSLKWGAHMELGEGRRWMREALAQSGASPAVRARALYAEATIAMQQGDWSAAGQAMEEALAHYRAEGPWPWTARSLERLAYVAVARRELERAEELLSASAAIAEEHGSRGWLPTMFSRRGRVAELRGDDARAAELYQEGVDAAVETGATGIIAGLAGHLGRVVQRLGDVPRAAAMFRLSLRTAALLGGLQVIAWELAHLAGVAAAGGRGERAARLFGAAEAVFATSDVRVDATDRPFYDANRAAARALLDEAAWDRLHREGAAMPLDDAIAYALAEEPDPAEEAAVPSPEPPSVDETAPAAGLRVRALGPLEIEADGQALEMDAKPRELLLYLLCHPRGRTREQAGLVFWPDASTAQVKNSFHVLLHRLRRGLGDAARVVLEDERYRVDPEPPVWFDAAVFEREVSAALREMRAGADAAARLEAALALYRGDFLRDEAAGDWHLEVHDRLRRLYVDALSALADRWIDRGEHARAIPVLERLVAEENLREDAHRRLMLALAKTGQRDRALRHHERLSALLRDELDAAPEPETAALLDSIRRGEVS